MVRKCRKTFAPIECWYYEPVYTFTYRAFAIFAAKLCMLLYKGGNDLSSHCVALRCRAAPRGVASFSPQHAAVCCNRIPQQAAYINKRLEHARQCAAPYVAVRCRAATQRNATQRIRLMKLSLDVNTNCLYVNAAHVTAAAALTSAARSAKNHTIPRRFQHYSGGRVRMCISLQFDEDLMLPCQRRVPPTRQHVRMELYLFGTKMSGSAKSRCSGTDFSKL